MFSHSVALAPIRIFGDYGTTELISDDYRCFTTSEKVIPGDTVLFSLKLASPIRRGLVHMTGEAFVGDKLVSQAEMLAQIVQDRVPSSASA